MNLQSHYELEVAQGNTAKEIDETVKTRPGLNTVTA